MFALNDSSHNIVPQTTAFAQEGLAEQEKVAAQIQQLGAVLTATELKSARRYWHLESRDGIKVFPKEYTRGAVGMLWQCMAQLQTWFGSAPYLAYGIQLLPLTPVAEHRDSIPWSEEIFHTYAQTCSADPSCATNGWSVLEYALLATIGHQEEAAGLALDLPLGVFDRYETVVLGLLPLTPCEIAVLVATDIRLAIRYGIWPQDLWWRILSLST